LAAGLRPDPLGELEHSPRPLSRNKGGLLLRGGKGREGRGREKEGRGGVLPYHFPTCGYATGQNIVVSALPLFPLTLFPGPILLILNHMYGVLAMKC